MEIQNEIWVEVAFQNFGMAIADHDLALAQDIIDDTSDKGFEEAAAEMQRMLQETPVSQFAISLDIAHL